MSSIGALFVVLVCGQALAAGEQRFAASDGKVSVTVQQKKASASPIQSCSTSETSYNVRLQSVKSKTTSFSRVLMNLISIELLASKLKNGTAQHIGDCAEMADEGGFAGFSFVDGLCKMFSLERYQPCRCDAGTGDLIYVQDSFWDKKDLHLPNLEFVGGEFLESVAYSKTVYDQRAHVDPAFKRFVSFPSTTPSRGFIFFLNTGGNAVACEGNTCFLILLVDVKHCSVGCSSTSTLVVRRLFTYKQRVLDEIAPIKYFLSECGNTITLDGTPTSDAGAQRRGFSHKGYGCQWYTKDAEDSECAVTFSNLSRGLNIFGYNIDGNTTSCEGDAVTVYSGASRNGTVLATITACDNTTKTAQGGGEMFVVFKRSANQYRQDGFNFGFRWTFS